MILLWPKNFETRIYANTNILCTQDKLYTWQKVEKNLFYAQETDTVTKSDEYLRSLSKILNCKKEATSKVVFDARWTRCFLLKMTPFKHWRLKASLSGRGGVSFWKWLPSSTEGLRVSLSGRGRVSFWKDSLQVLKGWRRVDQRGEEWLWKAGPKHNDDFNCGLSIAPFLRIEPSSLISF